MIERSVIAAGLGELAMVAPDLKRAIEGKDHFELAIRVWQKALHSVSPAEFRAAVDMALSNHSERNITPAAILKYCDQVRSVINAGPDFGDVFEDLISGIHNWEYHETQVDFNGWKAKHSVTEILARKLGGWSVISRDDVNKDVLRSNALKIYDGMTEKQKHVDRLPDSAKALPKLKNLIEGIGGEK